MAAIVLQMRAEEKKQRRPKSRLVLMVTPAPRVCTGVSGAQSATELYCCQIDQPDETDCKHAIQEIAGQ